MVDNDACQRGCDGFGGRSRNNREAGREFTIILQFPFFIVVGYCVLDCLVRKTDGRIRKFKLLAKSFQITVPYLANFLKSSTTVSEGLRISRMFCASRGAPSVLALSTISFGNSSWVLEIVSVIARS
jgi:hypothetical protein